MSTNSYDKDSTYQFSEVANLLTNTSDLKFQLFEKDLEIQSLRAELDSEKFLHNYVKELYKHVVAMEMNQCWN